MELWRVMPWQMWVLISGVLTGLAQAVGKKQLSRLSALQMGAVRDLAGLAIAVLVFFWWGTGNLPWQIVFAVGNGMMVAVLVLTMAAMGLYISRCPVKILNGGLSREFWRYLGP